jgi:hypothetical protein
MSFMKQLDITKYTTSDIRKTFLAVVIVLGAIDVYFKMMNSHWPPDNEDLLNKATYLAFSLWLGAGVLNQLLERARKEQWDEIRILTYKSLMSHICNLTGIVSINMAQMGDGALNLLADQEEVIGKEKAHPSKEAIVSMLLLAKMLYVAIEERNAALDSGEDWHIDANLMKSYYDVVSWRLIHIRDVLIPRVLSLSNNKAVCDSLVRFELATTKYEDEMRYRIRLWEHGQGEEDQEAMRHSVALAVLIEAASYVYGHIYDDYDPGQRVSKTPWNGKEKATPEEMSVIIKKLKTQMRANRSKHNNTE